MRTTGIVVVGLSAAILSFETWVQVAQSIGFTAHWSIGLWSGLTVHFWIAWLYPVAIDCFAMLVTREWMRSKADSARLKWARANSIGAIVLSYGGQAAYHAFGGNQPPTAYVIFMSGMPPLIVGLVVHLFTMPGAIETTGVVRPKRAIVVRQTTAPAVDQTNGPTEPPAPPVQAGPVEPMPTKPVQTKAVGRPRHGLHVVHGVVAGMADQIADEWPDQIPSRADVMKHFGWRSASQTSEAIKSVRTKRESGAATAVDADQSEEPDRAGELVGAAI